MGDIANAQVRLSPSGPALGPLGPGFQLRLAENTTLLTPENIQTTPAAFRSQNGNSADNATADLALPSPDRRYRVEGHVILDNSDISARIVTLQLQTSVDNKATWQNWPFSPSGPQYQVNANLADTPDPYTLVPFIGRMGAGASIANLVSGVPQLSVRILASSSQDDTIRIPGNNGYRLVLYELY